MWFFDFRFNKASPQNLNINSKHIDLVTYTKSISSSIQGTRGSQSYCISFVIIIILGFSTNVEPEDAQLSGYYLNCNGSQIALGTISVPSCGTMSIVFSFRPIDGAVSSVQTLLAISRSAPVFVVEYIPSNNSLNFRTNNPAQSASTHINAVSSSFSLEI